MCGGLTKFFEGYIHQHQLQKCPICVEIGLVYLPTPVTLVTPLLVDVSESFYELLNIKMAGEKQEMF